MTITSLTFLTVIIFITTVLKILGKEKCPGRKPFPLWAIKPFMYYVSATHNARKKATSSMKYLSGLSLPYDFMADSRISAVNPIMLKILFYCVLPSHSG